MRGCAATLLGLLVLATLLLPSGLVADEVRLKEGRPLSGTARRVGARVLVNPYGSTLESMTWGVVEVPADAVEEIVPQVGAGRLLDRLDGLPDADVAGRTVLLDQAEAARLRPVARRIAAEILRVRPDDARALKVVGGTERWAALRRGDPGLDPTLRREVAALLRIDSAEDRRRLLSLLERGTGWEPDGPAVVRMARSLREPRGTRHDVPLAWSDAAGATCSLHVPEEHHPLVPCPLVVALHGGLTERGAPILGTGRDAFALFEQEARRRGWILVAPTARAAPWNAAENVALVEAVVAETSARYAVDLERCYLVGQGAGADGALALEGRLPSTFAAVGAAGAAKPAAARGPTSRGVGVWLYHGTIDEIAPVAAAREAAAALLGRRADFVYAELPGMGHGLPGAAEQDLYRFLARHRRPRAKSPWPRSSLTEPVTADERRVLGDPAAAWDPGLPEEPAALRALLARGGPASEAAARRLAEHGLAAPDIVGDRAVPPHARAWAAWLCGRLRTFEALDPLADALRAEKDPFLRLQAAGALRRLRVPEATADLAVALEDVSGRYARDATKDAPLTFARLDESCHLLSAIVEAYAASSPDPDSAAAAIESHVVLAVLADRRPVRARPDLAEDPLEPRRRLARAVGRAYRTLDAEPTLMDLLKVTLKREPRVLAAAQEGFEEGVPRDE